MKQTVLLLTLLLILLTGCSNDNDSMYMVKLGTRTEGQDIFKNTTPYIGIKSFTKHKYEQDSPVETLYVGERAYEMKYTEKIEWTYEPDWEVYSSEDGNLEISIIEGNGGFDVLGKKDVIETFPENTISEEALISVFKEYMSSLETDINYDKYEYSFVSCFSCSGDNSAWYEEKEGFHPKDEENENESLIGYWIRFREYYNGIPTANQIFVHTDSYGNMKSITYIDYDVDWSSFTVNENEVASAVDSFMDKYVSSGEYKDFSYNVKSQTLGWTGEEIYLAVDVEMQYHVSHVGDGKYFNTSYEKDVTRTATLVLTQ